MKQFRFRIKPFRSSELVRYSSFVIISLYVALLIFGFQAFTIVFVLSVAFAILSHIETRIKINSALDDLEVSGMIPCEIEDLDPEFLEMIRSTKPYSVRPKEIKACITGSLDEREIVYIIFTKDIGEKISTSSAAAYGAQ